MGKNNDNNNDNNENNNNDNNNDKDYYLYFELTNINVIKTLFESFDKNVDIVRFVLSKNINLRLEISCTNTTRTFYFKSKFGNKLIKNLICYEEKIEIELLPNDLLNILKSHDSNDDLLLFYVYKSDDKKNTMVLEFKQIDLDDSINSTNSTNPINQDENSELSDSNENNNKKKIKKTKNVKKTKKNVIKEKKFTMKIGYPIYPEKQMTKINFDKKITIDSNKFHDVCKDLGILFNYVKISSKNNKNLYLEYDTSRCDGVIKFKYDNSNVVLENITNIKNNNISGIYHIGDIIGFSKLSSITTNYYFKLKNNYFLESTYVVGEYGNINITYIPLKDDMIKTSMTTSSTISSTISTNTDDSDNSDNISNISNISNMSNNEIGDENSKLKKNKKTINDKIIYVEIDKIELFKSLCECIEKIITEPIFKLETIDDKFSIKIICANNSKNINLNVCMENIFNRYKKLDKPVNLGIGLKYLNDILKTTDKTNKLILSIDEQDKHNLTIQIKNKNDSDEIELKRIYKIKLLNIEENDYESIIKLDNYSYIVSINSNEFYKICKDINTIGEEVKIVYDDKNITFSTVNDCGYINIIKK